MEDLVVKQGEITADDPAYCVGIAKRWSDDGKYEDGDVVWKVVDGSKEAYFVMDGKPIKLNNSILEDGDGELCIHTTQFHGLHLTDRGMEFHVGDVFWHGEWDGVSSRVPMAVYAWDDDSPTIKIVELRQTIEMEVDFHIKREGENVAA